MTIEHRCSDCTAMRDEAITDAVWLLDAGAGMQTPAVVIDVLTAALWDDVAQAHDEGVRP